MAWGAETCFATLHDFPNSSFLGLGIQLPTPTCGNMLRAAQGNMTSTTWLAFFPGLFIFLATLSINYIGDGLRDALDPRRSG